MAEKVTLLHNSLCPSENHAQTKSIRAKYANQALTKPRTTQCFQRERPRMPVGTCPLCDPRAVRMPQEPCGVGQEGAGSWEMRLEQAESPSG